MDVRYSLYLLTGLLLMLSGTTESFTPSNGADSRTSVSAGNRGVSDHLHLINPNPAAIPVTSTSVTSRGITSMSATIMSVTSMRATSMSAGFVTVSNTIRTCSTSIRVALGDVDERFQLTREDLMSEIRESARLWSDAMGQPLVIYDDEAGIPIHFIYEDQQELTDQERDLRTRIQQADSEEVVMEKELRGKEALYQQDAEAYEVESTILADRIEHLNQWVRKVNEGGGFNEDDLRQYHYRKEGVDRTAERLEERQERLIESGVEISELVSDINRRIEAKNQLIDEYNVRFSGVHYLTQGLYEWNATDRVIHIYQFGDREELKLVLTHEIGHALGIEHVDDEHAVMHRTIGDQQRGELRLTEADLAALRGVCSR